jgi:superfamily II DNA or RNA helicase
MKLFTTEHINFQFPWRTYQKRILENLDKHLEDRQLHIVAPPGSGKTVLGLEVVNRLNSPTLILAPTITIRNQWSERLTTDFLQGQPFSKATFDIKNPDLLTISTYQGLHTAFKANPEKVRNDLRKIGIQNLVVDECHHLKNEWWKTLFQLKEELNLSIIALTATPPFDVSGAEWQRYHQLCGEVDAEINVAELIADNNLCPHQDYIYFSMPTQDESIEITKFYDDVGDFIDKLKINSTFKMWIREHPFLQESKANLKAIYEMPDYFSALLIVNEFFNGSVPLGTVEILGGDIEDLPILDKDWLQSFLNEALFKDAYFQQFTKTEAFKNIIRQLRKIGAIERKKVVLTESDRINKKLRLSTSKLNSIATIVAHESQSLKDNLRMVILTDYIRKEEMPTSEFDIENQEKIGVVPIFERLRKCFPIEVNLGILSGSLVVIPKFALPQLKQIIQDKNLKTEQLSTKSLPHDSDYLKVETSGELSTKIVEVITELFTKGDVTVLVGTKSLLGEGWDAPAINTLVLATFVGSYVLSNQMRGRAIRTQKGNSNKTANIWHLICIDPTDNKGGHDFQILKRRFKAFHGVAFTTNPMIENGINRFHLPNFPIDAPKVNRINQRMLKHADNRSRLQMDWQRALGNGRWMVEEIKLPIIRQKSYQKVRSNITQTLIDASKAEIDRLSSNNWLVLVLNFAATFLTYQFLFEYAIVAIVISIITAISLFIANIKTYFKAFILLRKQRLITAIFNNEMIAKLSLIFILVSAISVGLFIFINLPVVILFLAFFALFFVLTRKIPFLNTLNYSQYLDFYENFEEEHFIKNIGQAIFKQLLESNYILPSDRNKITVKTNKNSFGEITCYLENASTFQNQLFLEALTEVINPIENPRYLIRISRDTLREYDTPFYAAVPSLFSKRKADATAFSKDWTAEISMNNLIYTRTPDGRLELLKARGLSLNPESHPKVERVSTWR